MNRPYTTIGEFGQEKEFSLKVVRSLKKHYTKYCQKVNGVVDTKELEKAVFKKVSAEIEPKTDIQKQILESTFDSFMGMMIFMGNSDMVFNMLEVQATGKLF